ncbi:MAG: peptidoglycan DD-metalloendopeptidase family protein [Vicinamibacterales bacterium]
MAITNITASSSPERPDPKATEREQLAHLAQEFEAMFISEMMKGMRASLLSDESDSGLGSQTMTDTFDSEFGRSMSNAGGLGLARVMLEALSRREAGAAAGSAPDAALSNAMASSPAVVADASTTKHATPRTAAPVAPAATDPATAYTARPRRAALVPTTTPVSTDGAEGTEGDQTQPTETGAKSGPGHEPLTTLPGPVTSKFGWRADPFTGRAQFHAGTDIRLAYGHDVQAVAPGTVKSVGERSGYGLTVVIDHGKGLETRYAHLSQASVKAGDVVDSGQVVARSGNSGRSTGPHLHLEARQNGRAVEMAALLKSSGMSAD